MPSISADTWKYHRDRSRSIDNLKKPPESPPVNGNSDDAIERDLHAGELPIVKLTGQEDPVSFSSIEARRGLLIAR